MTNRVSRSAGPLLALLALLAAPAGAAPPAAPAAAAIAVEEPHRIYLSPSGNDSNNGQSPASAIRTLARAQTVLRAAAPQRDVEVRIAQGTYLAPPTTWRFYVPGHTISFLPIDYEYGDGIDDIAGRPVFRSEGTPGYWLSARLPSGSPGGDTNLRFYYLRVERYSSGGVQFYGGVTTDQHGITVPATAGVNGNMVFGMYFARLGSAWSHQQPNDGWGAINTWNSSDNTIRNNHFVEIENIPSYASHIHGLYLAHHSSRNTIVHNRFYIISGDPIRTRNDSNDNEISNNRLGRAGRATGVGASYSEWFCDTDCVAANPGHARECASHGNFFHHNTTGVGYQGQSIRLWALYPPDLDYPGGTGCDNNGQKRLRTLGNTTPGAAP